MVRLLDWNLTGFLMMRLICNIEQYSPCVVDQQWCLFCQFTTSTKLKTQPKYYKTEMWLIHICKRRSRSPCDEEVFQEKNFKRSSVSSIFEKISEKFKNFLLYISIFVISYPQQPKETQEFPILFYHSPYLEMKIFLFNISDVSHVYSQVLLGPHEAYSCLGQRDILCI